MLVTGAAGGVGSVAIALLAKLGYQVIASTGRTSEADYLKGLGGGRDHRPRPSCQGPPRPLGKERWAGGIDAVGSHTLANVLSMTQYGGTVAACGLGPGHGPATSVAPFILRGVTLAGDRFGDGAEDRCASRHGGGWRTISTRPSSRAMTTMPLAQSHGAGARNPRRQGARARGARGRLAPCSRQTAARLGLISCGPVRAAQIWRATARLTLHLAA